MDGPWSKYQKPASGKPWEKYGKAEGGTSKSPTRSDAMKSGLSDLSAMTQGQQPEQSWWQWLYGNFIGDPSDGVENGGETLGRDINDVVWAGAAGVSRGVTGLVDLPANLADAYSGLVAGGLEATGMVSPEFAGEMRKGMSGTFAPLGGGVTGAASTVTGGATDFRGNTTAGNFASTVGEFLPGAAAFGGMSLANLLRFGVAPGVASEAAGQATDGSAWEPAARAAAALLAPSAVSAASRVASRVVSPYGGADPERLRLAQTLDDAGIPITAGQRVGSEALRRKEGLTTKGQMIGDEQAEAFTAAALKSIGVDAKRATPEVLSSAAAKIGAVFDDVTRGVDVTPDPGTVAALKSATETYKSLAPTAGQAPVIGQVADAMETAAASGATIPASTISVWRSRLSKLTTSSDAATREAAKEALEAVDDALAATLTAAGRGDAVEALSVARQQWRDFLAIQKAATSAGESAAAGLLSPSALRNAIVQQGRASYAQGRRGDLGDISRAAEGVMKRLPTSGTAENLRAMLAPQAVWSGLGAAAGSATPVGPVAGALIGALAPAVGGAVRMSRPVQAYLANQLAAQGPALIERNALSTMLPFAGEARNALAPR